MAKVYINGMEIIAISDTAGHLQDWKTVQLPQIDPSILPSGATRRMSKALKMSIWTSHQAIQQAQETKIDAIIVGTGKGCLIDSDKFLENLVSNQETYLTPTAFIQSTHNTVAGQIALQLKNHAYNMTFSQGRSSFESAILDAHMHITVDGKSTILVGGVDEISENSATIIDTYTNTSESPRSEYSSAEGVGFFILSCKKSDKSIATITDITIYDSSSDRSIDIEINNFITKNKLTSTAIDLIIMAADSDDITGTNIPKTCTTTATITYQYQSGRYDTDSTFALHLGASVLYNQTIPDNYSPTRTVDKSYQHILILNIHEQTSLILLSRC